MDEQIAEKVKMANKILGTINRIYDDKSKDNIVNLYKSLVHPHLEYAIQAWRPYKQKHIDALEKVQRRATRMIEGMSSMNYGERLKKTNLLSLEMRRLRADLIEVFKIMNDLEVLEAEDFIFLRLVVHCQLVVTARKYLSHFVDWILENTFLAKE